MSSPSSPSVTSPASNEARFVAGVRCLSEALWSRQQRKDLFDLAEGKPWSESQGDAALREAVGWLVRELALDRKAQEPDPHPVLSLSSAREQALVLPPSNYREYPSVSRGIVALAPLVDAKPNTLANQLVFDRSKARSIRWARLLGRLADESLPLDAWLFHRRTPGAVARQILSWEGCACFDAGDELLALSLLALWQRRRPTERVRANRGERKPRSATPKRIVSLLDPLITVEQRQSLVALASKLDDPRRRALLLFVIEAVLSAAHARSLLRGRSLEPLSVASTLVWAEDTVNRDQVLLGEEAEVLRFRVAAQRAFSQRQIVEWSASVSSAYILSSLCASRHREGVDGACADRFGEDEPGVCMLLPQLRQKERVRP